MLTALGLIALVATVGALVADRAAAAAARTTNAPAPHQHQRRRSDAVDAENRAQVGAVLRGGRV